MKYKYDGINKNKKIKEQRKKPLPIELMSHEKLDGIRIDEYRNFKNPDNCQDI
jgi:hypothetical protein